jgi:hypothetical protein
MNANEVIQMMESVIPEEVQEFDNIEPDFSTMDDAEIDEYVAERGGVFEDADGDVWYGDELRAIEDVSEAMYSFAGGKKRAITGSALRKRLKAEKRLASGRTRWNKLSGKQKQALRKLHRSSSVRTRALRTKKKAHRKGLY